MRKFSPAARAYTHGRGPAREQHNRRLARSHQLQFRAPHHCSTEHCHWPPAYGLLTVQGPSKSLGHCHDKHDSIIHARIIFSPTNTDQACGNNTPPFSSSYRTWDYATRKALVRTNVLTLSLAVTQWTSKSGRGYIPTDVHQHQGKSRRLEGDSLLPTVRDRFWRRTEWYYEIYSSRYQSSQNWEKYLLPKA